VTVIITAGFILLSICTQKAVVEEQCLHTKDQHNAGKPSSFVKLVISKPK